MSQVIERVKLSYRQGRSDKVYEIELIAEGNGLFHVVGYNGRRGAQLVAQPKTRGPVPLVTARRIFHQLEQAKLNHPRTPYHCAGRQTFQLATETASLAKPLGASAPVPPAENVAYHASHLDALEL
jgi:hypothetical protein